MPLLREDESLMKNSRILSIGAAHWGENIGWADGPSMAALTTAGPRLNDNKVEQRGAAGGLGPACHRYWEVSSLLLQT